MQKNQLIFANFFNIHNAFFHISFNLYDVILPPSTYRICHNKMYH